MVDHGVAVKAAQRYGYPIRLLRLALGMYRGQRRLVLGSTVSNPIWTERAIVAGCGLAFHIIALVCVGPADSFLQRAPDSLQFFSIYVDDFIAVYATSPGQRSASGRATVRREAVDGTKCMVELLERDARLPVSREKGKILASEEEEGRWAAAHLAELGFRHCKGAQALGVDWAGGKGIQHKASRERVAKASAKVKRLLAIRKGGGRILAACRAVAVGAARYGAKVIGLPDHLLTRTRRAVRAGTTTKAGGSSLTLDLHLQRGKEVDPTYAATTEPIVKWGREVYAADGEKKSRLAEAWRGGVPRVGLARKPWGAVAGPAGAVCATMRRIGWALVSWRHARTEVGACIDMTRVPPDELRAKVIAATRKAILGRVEVAEDTENELRKGIWLEPLRKVVLGKNAPLGGCVT